ARAHWMSLCSRGIIGLTSDTSRPSRCMAPPSAQNALSTSTRMSAVCAGSAFWESVVSMDDVLSGLPDHGVDVERFGELLAHQDVEVGLQGGDVELGNVERKVNFLLDLELDTGVLGDPLVSLFLAGVVEIFGRLFKGGAKASCQ